MARVKAIATADQMIRVREHDVVAVGGMQSMSQAPHLLSKSGTRFKYCYTMVVDTMAYDALFDQFTYQAMDEAGDEPTPRLGCGVGGRARRGSRRASGTGGGAMRAGDPVGRLDDPAVGPDDEGEVHGYQVGS
ncbi:hypothetical protein O3Q52_00265 [Streptomyces sp. ActVer]|uniref:thiolase family protein n=1 Tax=Streptomyces sp. ActVer TaxID=3014558 RepID=UPI0022B43C5B|nr:hypothetical protein [Streptomyces sp. ActVer]MCZ4506670.1 hypothetical protein [Streptomyces sp. ActVer]